MPRVTRLFRRLSLSAKLITSYLVILGVGGLAITVVGSWIVSTTIMSEARRTVKHDLAIARAVFEHEVEGMRRTLDAAATGITIPTFMAGGDTAALDAYFQELRDHAGLDFLTLADANGTVLLRAGVASTGDDAPAVARRALIEDQAVAGADLLSAERLDAERPGLADRARVPIRATRRSAPPVEDGAERTAVTDGLVLTAAVPVRDEGGNVIGVLYGGILVNRTFAIVDQVQDNLYRDSAGPDRNDDEGTVTIFLDDVRVSTNVRTEDGHRALGTRVSREVKDAVLEGGQTWNGRAFVVRDWYITAYEPLRSFDDRIVGMLYVGLPEASYVVTRNRVILSFLGIASVGFLLVLAVTYLGIQRMTRPLVQMAEATKSIAAGDFDQEIVVDLRSEGEISRLAGSFNLMLHSLRDMRADLEEWGRTLEEKVEERTDELVRMQSRVAQSERLASIGMLAAGVAHEVNNPLGGILALTALTLEDMPDEDPNRENLEEVVRQTERCRDIVKHLLEFSRQTEVSIEELDLNETLERTLGLLRRQSLFFNVEIEKDLDPDLPRVLADGAQLQQVFMNILLNAVEAMDEKGTLGVATCAVSRGEEVEVRLSDTGCGIPPEHLDHIFDPFFTTGKDGHGTGLGLSIAYGIVDRHQGSITAESEPGIGTTFVVRLPVTQPGGGAPARDP